VEWRSLGLVDDWELSLVPRKRAAVGGEMLSRPRVTLMDHSFSEPRPGVDHWTTTKHALLRRLHPSGPRPIICRVEGIAYCRLLIESRVPHPSYAQGSWPAFWKSAAISCTRPIRTLAAPKTNPLCTQLGRLNNYQQPVPTAPNFVACMPCGGSVYSRTITCDRTFTSRYLSTAVLWLASQYQLFLCPSFSPITAKHRCQVCLVKSHYTMSSLKN
jgi:hypothetical protein